MSYVIIKSCLICNKMEDQIVHLSFYDEKEKVSFCIVQHILALIIILSPRKVILLY